MPWRSSEHWRRSFSLSAWICDCRKASDLIWTSPSRSPNRGNKRYQTRLGSAGPWWLPPSGPRSSGRPAWVVGRTSGRVMGRPGGSRWRSRGDWRSGSSGRTRLCVRPRGLPCPWRTGCSCGISRIVSWSWIQERGDFRPPATGKTPARLAARARRGSSARLTAHRIELWHNQISSINQKY